MVGTTGTPWLWPMIALTAGVALGAVCAWIVLKGREAASIQAVRLSEVRLEEEARLLKGRLAEVQAEFSKRDVALAEVSVEKAKLDAKIESLEITEERQRKQFETLLLKTMGQNQEYWTKLGKEKEEAFDKHLKETLDPFKEVIERLDKRNTEMAESVRILGGTNSQVVAALSYNKGRGDWGEIELIRLLEDSGLTEGVGYIKQQVQQESKKRPDVRVNFPDGRSIFIDSKAIQVDLNDFPSGDKPDDHEQRKQRYAKSLKDAVKNLAAKEYQAEIRESADFVVLYVPREHMLSCAMEYDPNLWKEAFKDRVVISGPLNIMVLLRLVNQYWAMNDLYKNAEEIKLIATKLQQRAVVFGERYVKLGGSILKVFRDYQEVNKAFDGQQGLVKHIRRLEGFTKAEKTVPESANIIEQAPDVLMLES